MARPQSYSFSVDRGDTKRLQFVLWADAGKTQPADLVGVNVRAEIRQHSHRGCHGHGYYGHGYYGDMVPLAVTVTGNRIDLVLSHDASQQLAVVPSRWDLQLTYPSGDVQTVISGSVQIRGDVTGSTDALTGVA